MFQILVLHSFIPKRSLMVYQNQVSKNQTFCQMNLKLNHFYLAIKFCSCSNLFKRFLLCRIKPFPRIVQPYCIYTIFLSYYLFHNEHYDFWATNYFVQTFGNSPYYLFQIINLFESILLGTPYQSCVLVDALYSLFFDYHISHLAFHVIQYSLNLFYDCFASTFNFEILFIKKPYFCNYSMLFFCGFRTRLMYPYIWSLIFSSHFKHLPYD